MRTHTHTHTHTCVALSLALALLAVLCNTQKKLGVPRDEATSIKLWGYIRYTARRSFEMVITELTSPLDSSGLLTI